MTDSNAPLMNKEGAPVTNGEHRRVVYEVTAKVIAPIAALLIIVGVIAGALVYKELSDQTSDLSKVTQENRMLIERLERLERLDAQRRAQTRERFKLTDELHCQEIEKLKAAVRQEASEDFSDLRRNADLFGIELTPELQAAAKEELEETLKRFRGRPGGCNNLPSNNG